VRYICEIPQGLKPFALPAFLDTTEVVPCIMRGFSKHA
jgi:hypothetical protein